MRMNGHTFSGLSYVQYNPGLEGKKFKVDDDKIGILTGEPWHDSLPGPDGEELDVVLSRIAIFSPIIQEEVFDAGGEGE